MKPQAHSQFVLISFFAMLVVYPVCLPAVQRPGLAFHYYGERTFWYYAGTSSVKSLNFSLNLARFKWPRPNWDTSKGPEFHRNSGYCAALFGTLRVDKPGEYRFFAKGNEAMLRLANVRVDLTGQRSFRLEKGRVSLQLFVKSKLQQRDMSLKLRLMWQGPGMPGPREIPGSALSHSDEEMHRTEAFRPQIPMRNPSIRFFHRRDYVVEVSNKGFYEIMGHFAATPRVVEMTLDGQFLTTTNTANILIPKVPTGTGLLF